MEKIEHPYIRKNSFSGVLDKNLRKLEKRLGISLSVRGDSLLIDGDKERIKFAKYYFNKMKELDEKGYALKEEDYHIALDLLEAEHVRRLLCHPVQYDRHARTDGVDVERSHGYLAIGHAATSTSPWSVSIWPEQLRPAP